MANRYGEEDVGRLGHGGSRADREPRRERESGERRGGHYGMGGAERGYNMGGYGGMESYEQGYKPGSYDRLLDVTERYHGYGDEAYGHAREGDERYWYEQEQRQRRARAESDRPREEQPRPGAVGFGGEPWSDEWMSFERSQGEEPRAMEWTARGRGPGKAPKGYTRADARIREDICERIMHSPYDASEVEITVTGGEVTLTGTVRSRADKWGIEDVAEAILGVQEVHNQIRINREGAQSSGATLGGDMGHMDS